MKQSVTFVFALLAAAGAQAACYTVLGPKGEVLSESPNPPVDMAYQLHQTVPYKYGPGARMVFGLADGACGEWVDTYAEMDNTTSAAPVKGKKNRRRAARRDRE
jgi:hypothetical protein